MKTENAIVRDIPVIVIGESVTYPADKCSPEMEFRAMVFAECKKTIDNFLTKHGWKTNPI